MNKRILPTKQVSYGTFEPCADALAKNAWHKFKIQASLLKAKALSLYDGGRLLVAKNLINPQQLSGQISQLTTELTELTAEMRHNLTVENCQQLYDRRISSTYKILSATHTLQGGCELKCSELAEITPTVSPYFLGRFDYEKDLKLLCYAKFNLPPGSNDNGSKAVSATLYGDIYRFLLSITEDEFKEQSPTPSPSPTKS